MVPKFISRNVPLADKNWFKTGGPATWYAQPTTAHEFAQAVEFANKQQMPIFVLGEGANILISDAGFDGLVIRPHLQDISHCVHEQQARLTAGAGTSMHKLIEYCLENNLLGLEEFSGIPGTVGGAVYINLHYFQFLLSQFMRSAHVLHKKSGIITEVGPEWFNFGYDYSKLHEGAYFLVDATFNVRTADAHEIEFARGRRTEIIRHRNARYPTANTCGSFFRNFHEHEVTLKSAGKKVIWVAYYLDKIGIKGALSVGGASVSYQHANMIVNNGTATSKDIIDLARQIQQLVYEHFGIVPQPECQLVGFGKKSQSSL